MKYQRILNLKQLLEKKSFFLFGPRGTGKTTLIREQIAEESLVINLLHTDYFLPLSENPSLLEEMIAAASQKKWVVIDEVQKIPQLLNEVHRLIEEKHVRFLLTGSSARSLRRGGANLLAGRAWTAHLFPLCSHEIPDFQLDRYLQFGGQPAIYGSAEPHEELAAYVQTYLREEILAEGLIRKLPPFARFLKAAALSNGTQLNFANISNDCQVSASTVREYYSILEDTLGGFNLEAWTESRKRKATTTAKFYFFDTGVTHTIAGTKELDRNSNLYGASFEQFIGMEIRAYLDYRRIREPLTFWRTTNGVEVDFLIGEKAAIEVKSTARATEKDKKGLRALQEEGVFQNFYLVTQDRIKTKKDNIIQIHWKDFLQQLWDDAVV